MKIIHCPYTYFPDSAGGTEVYVHALARELQLLGVENLIVASAAAAASAYQYEGVDVVRLSLSDEQLSLRQLYGEGDPVVAMQFENLLDEERPSLIHLHAFTSATSILFVQAAKARNIPVVFTYHTPTVSCARGTLLEWGTQICDGKMSIYRCAPCVLQGQGMNKVLSKGVGVVPTAVGQQLGKVGLRGGAFTALRMSELMDVGQTAVYQLWQQVDAIVALCGWVKELLLRNGVEDEKITVCRHGLAQPFDEVIPTRKQAVDEPVRLVFLGRLHPTKGIDILIEALCQLPDAPVRLDIYGIAQEEADEQYQQSLKTLIQHDKRVQFFSPVKGDEVIPLLRHYDMLVVPSQWLETGPLVVLEAFAAGIPVLGSDLGGIAEWVIDNENGLLVDPFDDVEAWKAVLSRLATDEQLLPVLRQGVVPPRMMSRVAQEMLTLYETLV